VISTCEQIGQRLAGLLFHERVKRSLLILAFLIVPLFLALFGNRLLFLEVENPLKVAAESHLDEALDQIEAERNPFEFYSTYFQRIEKLVFSAHAPFRAWKKIIPALKRRFRNKIELIFLDGSGKPVKGFADRPISGVLAKKFFESYRIFLAERKPLSETAVSFLKSFLGSFLPIERESHGWLQCSTPPPNEQFVYFSRPYSKGMIIMFLKPTRPLNEMVLDEHISRIHRLSPKLRLAIAQSREKAGKVLKNLSLSGIIPPMFWKILDKASDGKAWFGDILLARRSIYPSLWVVGCTSIPAPEKVFNSLFLGSYSFHVLIWSLIFILIVILILTFAGALYPFEVFITSVRMKLVLSFLYAVLVPLIIMGITAGNFLSERMLVMENETHQKAEKSLIRLDNMFDRFWKNLREILKTHHYAPDYSGTDSYEDFTGNFEKYRKKYGFDMCRIFDAKGKQVLNYYDPDLPTVFGGFIKLLSKLARGLFAQNSIILPESSPSETTATSTEEPPKVDPFLAMANVPYTTFLGQEILLGGIHCYLGSIPLSHDDKKPMYLAFFVWFRKKMELNYIKQNLGNLAKIRGSADVLVWAPDTPEKIHPASFRFANLCRPFMPKVNSSSHSFRTRVSEGSHALLITGLKGTNLKHFSFLTVTPDLDIQLEMHDLSWKFSFITLAILGICLIIGFLLARLFITPIGNLTSGMEAISNRDFRHPIPVSSGDELGKLADLFNGAMEDLRDLEVATTVQESLFPQEPLHLGQWEIFGSCVSASQVGGDYFDYFRLDEHRGLVIIGDVSGHGIGAALVVAMAKAIIGHPASSGKPIEILASLNGILFTILKRKKMMSCCLSIFDTQTGILTMANAGQSFPILLGKGSPRFLELKGYPLGSTKNWKAATAAFGMNENDVVLFYTDGLIEANDTSGQQIGYERFIQQLPSLIVDSAAATENAIRRWHKLLTREVPPDDDISLIVLQRGAVQRPPYFGKSL